MMSDEPTERDVEALAEEVVGCWGWNQPPLTAARVARAVLASDWYAERIADAAQRAWDEGWAARAEYAERRDVPLDWPDLNPYRADPAAE